MAACPSDQRLSALSAAVALTVHVTVLPNRKSLTAETLMVVPALAADMSATGWRSFGILLQLALVAGAVSVDVDDGPRVVVDFTLFVAAKPQAVDGIALPPLNLNHHNHRRRQHRSPTLVCVQCRLFSSSLAPSSFPSLRQSRFTMLRIKSPCTQHRRRRRQPVHTPGQLHTTQPFSTLHQCPTPPSPSLSTSRCKREASRASRYR